jgi:hypothetical protein
MVGGMRWRVNEGRDKEGGKGKSPDFSFLKLSLPGGTEGVEF